MLLPRPTIFNRNKGLQEQITSLIQYISTQLIPAIERLHNYNSCVVDVTVDGGYINVRYSDGTLKTYRIMEE